MRLHSSCLVGVLFCGLFIASPAHAQPMVMYDTFMTPTVDNPCTGETLVVTGRTVISMYVRPGVNGATHFTFRQIDKGTATTLDMSKKYVINNEQIDEVEGNLMLGPVEVTNVHNEGIIRQGETDALLGGDDFFVKSTAHITINSNGIPTATVGNSHGGCM